MQFFRQRYHFPYPRVDGDCLLVRLRVNTAEIAGSTMRTHERLHLLYGLKCRCNSCGCLCAGTRWVQRLDFNKRSQHCLAANHLAE